MCSKVKLGDICDIECGKGVYANIVNGSYPYVKGNLEIISSNTFTHETECILFTRMGEMGNVIYWNKGKFTPNHNLFIIKKKANVNLDYRYLYLYLLSNKNKIIQTLSRNDTNIPTINIKDLQSFYVYIPSLELQLELVEYHNLLEEKEKKIQKQKELFLTLFQYDVSVLSFINSI